MKQALFMLLALFYAGPLIAQTDLDHTAKDEASAPTREIGFSTQIILDNIFESSGAPIDVMFKKYKGDHKWMRYGLSLWGAHLSNDYLDSSNNSSSHSSVTLNPSVGFEHRKSLLKRWNVVYGGDLYLHLHYSRSFSNYFNTDYQFNRERTDKGLSTGAGIRPFIGVTFNITPRLYLSTEAFANVNTYFRRNISETENEDGYTKSKSNHWGFNVYVRPASAIFVYYRF